MVIGKWLLVEDLRLKIQDYRLQIAHFYIHHSQYSIVVYIIANLDGMFNENRIFL